VVNAGILDHPVTSEPIVGFVSRGAARKLDDLRHRCDITVVFRSGWEWVAGEGTAQLAGPTMILPDSGAKTCRACCGWCTQRQSAAPQATGRRWTSRWRPNGTRLLVRVSHLYPDAESGRP
jgi:hypothetical protein